MKKLTFNHMLALVSTMSLVAGSQAVYAQQAAEKAGNIEEVVVTGYRGSLLNAIDAKRNADTVVEVLSADELGGLPDVSIADALGRLPGVSTVRTGGQAGEINIRGLSGDFVHSTLNGREQPATSGSRKIDFDQYPSELISQGAIYKSPKASLIEGGVAGTVELTTADPLKNGKDNSFNVNVRGSYNDRADEVNGSDDFGYRLSGSYQGKFADDTFGVALGYSRLFQPHVSSQFVGLQYNNTGTVTNTAGATVENAKISEGFELQQKGGEETRDGYMATLQWQPVDSFSMKGDFFYTKFESETYARGFRVKTLSNGTITNATVQPNGAVTGGTVTNNGNAFFNVQTTNDDNTLERELLSGGIKAEWTEGPWTVSTDLSHSETESVFSNGVNWGIYFDDLSVSNPAPEGGTQVSYQLNGLGVPSVDFHGRDFTDTNHVAMAKAGIYPYISDDKIDALKIDVKFDLEGNSFFSSFEAGVRLSEREFNAERGIFEYGNDFGAGYGDQVPLTLQAGDYEEVNFGGQYADFPSFLAIDVPRVLANAGIDARPFKKWANDWTMIQSGRVNEDVFAAYIQANIEAEAFGKPLTGNVGVRMVETDQQSTGFQKLGLGQGDPIADDTGVINNDFVRATVGQKYTDYLPSINLNFHVTDNDQVRFAAASVMARAPIDKLKSGGGSWTDAGKYNVWGGTSPLLDPFYADQYDLSYEHYFDDTEGAIALALFYKDIKSFIENVTIDPFDFDAAGITKPIDPVTGNPFLDGQYQTAQNNDKGGYIRGVELGYTQTFENLPGIWSGLGMNASYAYTETEISKTSGLNGETIDIGLPGLSPYVFNATVFFDYEGFSTRLSVRHRDEFVAEIVAVETQEVFFDKETVMDYQASYAFDSGVDITFQILNLTDEPTRTFFGTQAQTGTLQNFGRQFYLGANYKF